MSMVGIPVICRLGGDEGEELVGRRGIVVGSEDVEESWVSVAFDDELLICYLVHDWRPTEWQDDGGWFITDCSAVVEPVHEMDASLMAGLAILSVVLFTIVLCGTALVLR